ncbi:hypothetical protein TrCOL_g2339 [Triparma columacea]|uniref:EF-hand domain-containing protein n=1 Tax=Triparma columacea TaxID=722753 RepID=A0A9W7G4T4_9STRA|nr:hypothetical protein TrCOL_g2339 [Triparma columacea]
MSFDPRSDADAYLASNKVIPLFHDLGTKLLYSKPSDPNAFLKSTLEEIQESKNRGVKSSFFTEKDVLTMYKMFDPTGRGSVSREQYGEALKSMGVDEPTVEVGEGRVGKEDFEKNFKIELDNLSLT